MKTPKLKFVPDRQEVFVGNKEVRLACKEWKILELLRNKNVTLSREQIMLAIWGHNRLTAKDTRTIDQHIARLRKKLRVPVVKTVTGFGYKFCGA